jgi:hypothetical protein
LSMILYMPALCALQTDDNTSETVQHTLSLKPTDAR